MKPPQHRILPLEIIDPGDEAWDTARANAEVEDLDTELVAEHPIYRYRSGETLFDLDAPGEVYVEDDDGERSSETHTAREYLTGEPAVFEAVRLTPSQIAGCLQRGDSSGALMAFYVGVKQIRGVDFDYKVSRKKTATDAQLVMVQDYLGYDVIERIGRQVLRGSRAPTPREKKP